jgi:hypothetical protein
LLRHQTGDIFESRRRSTRLNGSREICMEDGMRSLILIVIVSAITVGCSHAPTAPNVQSPGTPYKITASASQGKNFQLWGEWEFLINAAHDKVDVVPKRAARFHLNALKFLESYCTDCLKITQIKNNGDSTIDLTVQIKHPFPGIPQYTGFDTKGIIMFDGSWTDPGNKNKKFYPWPDPFRVSWRKLGDPQVLNADGYTGRWSPTYDSGSQQPIFNYWPGKYANGTPTANINAYMNFYTTENRHMFTCYGQKSRTYHIWLPKGPVVAGYAVEACWEPPTKTPVTNPALDFPLTANQPEAYEFYVNLHNGQPIIELPCCGQIYDPSDSYLVSKQWGGHTAQHFAFYTGEYWWNSGYYMYPCGDSLPDEYCNDFFLAENFPDGDYMGVAINFRAPGYSPEEIAYTVFEFTIDLQ